MATAKLAIGSAEKVGFLIDEGQVWAFDLSANPKGCHRLIRIWSQSLGGVKRMDTTLESVLDDVVGPDPLISSSEAQARFCVDDNTIHRLVSNRLVAGKLVRQRKALKLVLSCPSFRRFLESRAL